MEVLTIIFGIAGGLALFLYGVHVLSEGLQRAAGGKLKLILEKLTNKPIKGVATGALITAVIQSSSITTVTLIGLINAGLVNLMQAAGVIMGANIGTTITAQLVAFHIGRYALPIIAIGTLIFFTARKKKYHCLSQILLGFGILFLGMNLMGEGAEPLSSSAFFLDMMEKFSKVPVLGVAAGAIFTGLIQSSSATTGLVIAMGMKGLLSLKAAIAIIIGANIGTCVTALIASIGTSISAKRAAIVHISFNVSGALIFIPIISLFSYLVSFTATDLPRQIANAHTLFNIMTTLIMFPLMFILVFIAKKVVPGKDFLIDRGVKFLDERILRTPSIALSQADKETLRMADMTNEMLNKSVDAFMKNDKDLIRIVIKQEEAVDELYENIDRYLAKIPERKLSRKGYERLAILKHSINDIERVGDHLNNVVELAERKMKSKLVFSEAANREMSIMFDEVKRVYKNAIKALKENDERSAKITLKLEDDIDEKEKEFEANHIRRLEKGICHPASGIIFVDTLRNLERISDHSRNIANSVVVGF